MPGSSFENRSAEVENIGVCPASAIANSVLASATHGAKVLSIYVRFPDASASRDSAICSSGEFGASTISTSAFSATSAAFAHSSTPISLHHVALDRCRSCPSGSSPSTGDSDPYA